MYALITALGLASGCFMEQQSLAMILRRTDSEEACRRISASPVGNTVAWMLLNAVCWLGVFTLCGMSLYSLEIAVVISVCVMLAAVDITARKIPNELLLALFVTHLAVLLADGRPDLIPQSTVGLALGFLLFLLPSFMGKGAGFGDVKFAAVVGWILGAYGFFFMAALMAMFLIPYLLYLLATRKGGLKTQVALGPYMAASLIVVLLVKTAITEGMFRFI